MTAHVDPAGSPLRGTIARGVGVLVTGACLAMSTAADAQIGALASIYSDYRFRGVSLSDGRPVAILDVSYDLRNGIYAALSGRAVMAKSDGPQPLGYAANIGYAFQIHPTLTADIGVVHSAYSHYSGIGMGRSYTEAYAGIIGKLVGVRLSVSPDYLGTPHWTAYGEVNGHLNVSRRTTLEGDIGLLSSAGGTYHGPARPQFDARVGLSQRAGQLVLHAAVTARNRAYVGSTRSEGRFGIVLGVSAPL